MVATFKVSVDRGKCCGYAICAEMCPEVYKLDDQGFAFVIQEEVGEELLVGAREAAASCPENAITVEALS